MTPREKAIEAVEAAPNRAQVGGKTITPQDAVDAIEAAGLLIVDPAAGTDALLAAVFADELDPKGRGPAYQRGRADGRLEERAAGDGAVPATAGDPLAGTPGGGLVGPTAPEGDHASLTDGTVLREQTAGELGLTTGRGDDSARWAPSRAQVMSDDELEQGDVG